MELNKNQLRFLELGLQELAKAMGLETFSFAEGVSMVKSTRLANNIGGAEFFEIGFKEKGTDESREK